MDNVFQSSRGILNVTEVMVHVQHFVLHTDNWIQVNLQQTEQSFERCASLLCWHVK